MYIVTVLLTLVMLMMCLMLIFYALRFWFLCRSVNSEKENCGGWVFSLRYTICFSMDFLEYNHSLIISLDQSWIWIKTSLFLELFNSPKQSHDVEGQMRWHYWYKQSPLCGWTVLIKYCKRIWLLIRLRSPLWSFENQYIVVNMSTFVFLKSFFFFDKHPLSYKEITQLKVIKMYLSPCCPTEIELWSKSDVYSLSPLGKLIWKFLFHWQHSFLTFLFSKQINVDIFRTPPDR